MSKKSTSRQITVVILGKGQGRKKVKVDVVWECLMLGNVMFNVQKKITLKYFTVYIVLLWDEL